MDDMEEKRAKEWARLTPARANCTCINPFSGTDAPYVGVPKLLCQNLGCCSCPATTWLALTGGRLPAPVDATPSCPAGRQGFPALTDSISALTDIFSAVEALACIGSNRCQ